MKTTLLRLTEDFLHLIAPGLCPGCDEPFALGEHEYCRACRASLPPAPFPAELMTRMAARFPPDELALDAVGSLYEYAPDGAVRKLIHAVKYQGCVKLGVEMGRELGRALRMFAQFNGIDLVVPVPLHRARLRERGYNQAEAIARGIAGSIAGAQVANVLARSRHVSSQTTLDADARRGNVRGVFVARNADVRGRCVLLCDDVCTTGATLNACAEMLAASGAARVLAATLASDPLANPAPERITSPAHLSRLHAE